MLVISRRLHEKVLFPSINVSVEVVAAKNRAWCAWALKRPHVAIFLQQLDRIQGQRAKGSRRSLSLVPPCPRSTR